MPGLGELAGLVAALCWSLTSLLMRVEARRADVIVLNALRTTAAAGYLASAVDTLGHAIIEHERVKGLRRAMALAQPGLQTLAGLLAGGDELIAQQIVAYRNYILEDANDTINAAPAAINRVEIAAMVGGPVADANLAVKRLAQLNQGVRLIPAAHRELADSICEDRPGLASLKALLSEAQRVATFRAHLY